MRSFPAYPAYPAYQGTAAAGTRLLVAEQLMLVAFSADGRLNRAGRQYLPVGVAGAVLTELAIRGSISITPRGSSVSRSLVLGLPPATGDPLLDGTAFRIQAQPPRALGWWLKSLSRSGLQGEVANRLLASGIAVISRGTFTTRLQLTEPANRAEAVARVWQAVQSGPAAAAGLWAADPWSAALTSLAFGCQLVSVSWLPRSQRGAAKMSMLALRRSDPIGVTVALAVEQARRAAASSASSAAMTASMSVGI